MDEGIQRHLTVKPSSPQAWKTIKPGLQGKRKPSHVQECSSENGNGRRVRLLALDLDGTLLNSRSQISEANLQALAGAHGLGVQIAVVTGRRFHSAIKFVKQIPCPVTVISSNGARIGTPDGKVLYRNFLPAMIASQALKIADDFRAYAVVMFDISGRGQVVMHTQAAPDSPVAWYLRSDPDCLAQLDDFETAFPANGSDPVQVMFGGPFERIAPAESLLRESGISSQMQLGWTRYPLRDVNLLEVMNLGCSKARALAFWTERLGIDSSETMACGDNYNDFEMLEFAGYPVLMSNYCPGLEPGPWLRTASNDDDGVALAIQRLVLS